MRAVVRARGGGANLSQRCLPAAGFSDPLFKPLIAYDPVTLAQSLGGRSHVIGIDETAAAFYQAKNFFEQKAAALIFGEVMERAGRNNRVELAAYRSQPI